MRTTLDIDDDVLLAIKDLSKRQKKTAGEVLTELARKALNQGSTTRKQIREPKEFYGFKTIPKVAGLIITNEQIDRLRDEEGI